MLRGALCVCVRARAAVGSLSDSRAAGLLWCGSAWCADGSYAQEDLKHTVLSYGNGKWDDARRVFEQVALADDFVDFLTLPAYDLLD